MAWGSSFPAKGIQAQGTVRNTSPQNPKESKGGKREEQGKVAARGEVPLRGPSSLESAHRFYININGFLKRDTSGKTIFTMGYEVRAADWEKVLVTHTWLECPPNQHRPYLQNTYLSSRLQVITS